MRLTSFNIAAMLLMLAIGIALGALVFRNVPNTMAAIDRPLAQPVTASSPAIATALEGQEPSAFTRLSDDAKYAGVVFARQSADIVARADGTLQAVFVNLGDRLKAGDVIARAESYSSTQQLQMAEATLRSAHAEQQDAELGVKDAETRYRRREALEEAGLISREDLATARVQLDRAEAKQQSAQARVAEQTARVNEAQESLANTTIRAPFDGTVAARYLDAGAAVRFGTPVMSLIRPEDLWVRFAIPATQQARMRMGSSIEFKSDGLAALAAVIEYVSPSITATSQELLVEARLKAPAALRDQIKPGQSGIVSSQTR